MVSVLASSGLDRGLESRSGLTKDYKIVIFCFFSKYAALSTKTCWLGIGIMCPSGATCLHEDCCFSDNVSEWGHMSARGLLFQ